MLLPKLSLKQKESLITMMPSPNMKKVLQMLRLKSLDLTVKLFALETILDLSKPTLTNGLINRLPLKVFLLISLDNATLMLTTLIKPLPTSKQTFQ